MSVMSMSHTVSSIGAKMNLRRYFQKSRALLLIIPLMLAGCARNRIIKAFEEKEFPGANFSGINLYYRNLEKINLQGARLIRSNLSFSVLRNARMANADLREADLSAADLTGADLRGANCRKVDLKNAILRKSNLTDCYLYDSDLSGADLREAVLALGPVNYSDYLALPDKISRGEVIYYAHLRNANLAGAVINKRWKKFISLQNAVNIDKIVWVK